MSAVSGAGSIRPYQRSSKSVGQTALALVQEAGYAAQLGADEETGEWLCVCSKTMLATYDGVVEAQTELNQLVAHLDNCSTDGWGTFGNLD